MIITLTQDLFENNKYSFLYGNREVLFTIVDEEFAGMNTLGRINRMVIQVKTYGEADKTQYASTVIGVGDGVINIYSSIPELKGKLLNKDNMTNCTIELPD